MPILAHLHSPLPSQEHKKLIADIEVILAERKRDYTEAMRRLEGISDDIHRRRGARHVEGQEETSICREDLRKDMQDRKVDKDCCVDVQEIPSDIEIINGSQDEAEKWHLDKEIDEEVAEVKETPCETRLGESEIICSCKEMLEISCEKGGEHNEEKIECGSRNGSINASLEEEISLKMENQVNKTYTEANETDFKKENRKEYSVKNNDKACLLFNKEDSLKNKCTTRVDRKCSLSDLIGVKNTKVISPKCLQQDGSRKVVQDNNCKVSRDVEDVTFSKCQKRQIEDLECITKIYNSHKLDSVGSELDQNAEVVQPINDENESPILVRSLEMRTSQRSVHEREQRSGFMELSDGEDSVGSRNDVFVDNSDMDYSGNMENSNHVSELNSEISKINLNQANKDEYTTECKPFEIINKEDYYRNIGMKSKKNSNNPGENINNNNNKVVDKTTNDILQTTESPLNTSSTRVSSKPCPLNELIANNASYVDKPDINDSLVTDEESHSEENILQYDHKEITIQQNKL